MNQEIYMNLDKVFLFHSKAIESAEAQQREQGPRKGGMLRKVAERSGMRHSAFSRKWRNAIYFYYF